ncbi:sensor histidine kinase [Noviherbaspirillum saxi]|uniref:histidine kinase n=1 Tax=Noviherbaspirillum saxi TaxID=2320863 RepID=A0A3A3FHX1_9BURK|nr:ATP-binding protein [Noviherbaspirillum saxi]RJF92114.1 GHKL domain-containing protein [Noviherbaspirillum saxi]
MDIARRLRHHAPLQPGQNLIGTEAGDQIDIRTLGRGTPALALSANSANPTLQQFRSNVARLLNVESKAERERSRNHEALVHAGKMAAVGRLVANVNHEIKRPLASMHLLVENTLDLIERGETKAAAENLSMLLQATDQLAELSRQLEGFSRKTATNKMAVSVGQAVERARTILSPKIKTGQYRLQVQVIDQPVVADVDRLALAIVNLIDNAMDATANTEDKRIHVEAAQEGEFLAIRVRDHGPGIAPEAMEKLFEAFFTTKPAGKGIGLGLALSNEVITEMGGHLGARNHPDGGAEFVIQLPRANGETH